MKSLGEKEAKWDDDNGDIEILRQTEVKNLTGRRIGGSGVHDPSFNCIISSKIS